MPNSVNGRVILGELVNFYSSRQMKKTGRQHGFTYGSADTREYKVLEPSHRYFWNNVHVCTYGDIHTHTQTRMHARTHKHTSSIPTPAADYPHHVAEVPRLRQLQCRLAVRIRHLEVQTLLAVQEKHLNASIMVVMRSEVQCRVTALSSSLIKL